MTNISVLTKCAELFETNPEAAEFLSNLANAETALEIQQALDAYDSQTSNN